MNWILPKHKSVFKRKKLENLILCFALYLGKIKLREMLQTVEKVISKSFESHYQRYHITTWVGTFHRNKWIFCYFCCPLSLPKSKHCETFNSAITSPNNYLSLSLFSLSPLITSLHFLKALKIGTFVTFNSICPNHEAL